MEQPAHLECALHHIERYGLVPLGNQQGVFQMPVNFRFSLSHQHQTPGEKSNAEHVASERVACGRRRRCRRGSNLEVLRVAAPGAGGVTVSAGCLPKSLGRPARRSLHSVGVCALARDMFALPFFTVITGHSCSLICPIELTISVQLLHDSIVWTKVLRAQMNTPTPNIRVQLVLWSFSLIAVCNKVVFFFANHFFFGGGGIFKKCEKVRLLFSDTTVAGYGYARLCAGPSLEYWVVAFRGCRSSQNIHEINSYCMLEYSLQGIAICQSVWIALPSQKILQVLTKGTFSGCPQNFRRNLVGREHPPQIEFRSPQTLHKTFLSVQN